MKEKTLLIIDDSKMSRDMLSELLMNDYNIILACNGENGFETLKNNIDVVSAVLLDIVMPEMDGFSFLTEVKKHKDFDNIPVVVVSSCCDCEFEAHAFELGAWDYIRVPFNIDIIKYRINNAVQRSLLSSLKNIRFISEHDTLTGFYNRDKFFKSANRLFELNKGKAFYFIRLDIRRFSLINSCYGNDKGDEVLVEISKMVRQKTAGIENSCYGRMEADVFCVIIPKFIETDALFSYLEKQRNSFASMGLKFHIVPKFGIYITTAGEQTAEYAYECAKIAATSQRNGDRHVSSIFGPALKERTEKERRIVNDMYKGIENEEFCVYYQPKFNLSTLKVSGSEALVRWKHPQHGMIPPGDFIPVFEKNGFITNLDFYVWEHVCMFLRKSLDNGKNVLPVSVNVSRLNIYMPNFVEEITGLIEKYNLPLNLFELEVTESAYTENQETMINVIERLRKYGFKILMDDFGSGYSSLNILKDMSIDTIKIDMLFLRSTKHRGRGENIVSGVIRMANWLRLPVVAEGVETVQQVEMLRSIGCEYAQGYYFARPMSVDEFEKFCDNNTDEYARLRSNLKKSVEIDEFWKENAQISLLLNIISDGVAIYEWTENRLELIRANDNYYKLTCESREDSRRKNAQSIYEWLTPEDSKALSDTLNAVLETGDSQCCMIKQFSKTGKAVKLKAKFSLIAKTGARHLFYGAFTRANN